MRLPLVLVILALILSVVPAAGGDDELAQSNQSKQQLTVAYLTASACVEPIGGNVSSILREKIRGSNGYTLAETPPFPENALGPEILLMCTDVAGEPITAVSFLISFRVGRTRDISLHGLDIIGRAKVDQEAQSIFSKFDNWWSEFSATQSYKKQ